MDSWNPWLALFIVEAILVLGAILIAVHKHGRHPLAGGPPDDNWWKASAWLIAAAIALLVVAMFVDWVSSKMGNRSVTQAAVVSTQGGAVAPSQGVIYSQGASTVVASDPALTNRVSAVEQTVAKQTGDIAIVSGRLDLQSGRIRTLQGSRVVVTQPVIADNSRGGFQSLSDCLQRTRAEFSRDGEVNPVQVQEFCAAHGWVTQTVVIQQPPAAPNAAGPAFNPPPSMGGTGTPAPTP